MYKQKSTSSNLTRITVIIRMIKQKLRRLKGDLVEAKDKKKADRLKTAIKKTKQKIIELKRKSKLL